jgi:hypothetical protein
LKRFLKIGILDKNLISTDFQQVTNPEIGFGLTGGFTDLDSARSCKIVQIANSFSSKFCQTGAHLLATMSLVTMLEVQMAKRRLKGIVS